jgi:putative transposase
MPRNRYRVRQESCPHFLTATINHWLPLFTRQETVNIVLDSWRFLQREAGLVIYGYVILENHLHLIATSEKLSRDIQRFKSFTAREIIAYLESGGSKRLLELLALFKRSHKTESQYQFGRKEVTRSSSNPR